MTDDQAQLPVQTTPQDDVPMGKMAVLLSGLGFYRLSQKRRKRLSIVFLGSLGVHILALLLFGGWIIMRPTLEQVTMFRTPAPTRKYEPRKLEHKVKLQKRQRSSSRPAMMPRMVSLKLSNLALPEIKVDPKVIHTTFQPKFKAVSGRGLGVGLGTGYGTHGFGSGVSSVNFFGIHARGEKIAILVDVSVSMVEAQRGGVQGFERVKARLNQVVDALPETSLFNVVVFADAASIMEPKMVIANNDNKKRAKMYIRPYNTEGNWGLTHGNVTAASIGKRAEGGTTRLDLALTAAFQNGADTILIISDGAPRVKKGYSQSQLRAHQVKMTKWGAENSGRVAKWDAGFAAAQANVVVQSSKVWVQPQPARAAVPAGKRPLKEGAPIPQGRPAQAARPGHWRTVTHSRGGWSGPARPKAPKLPDAGYWTLTDFVDHCRVLHKAMYLKKGKKPPQVHCIGYQIDKEGHAFLSKLSRTYHGKYRRVKSLKNLR